MFFNHILPALVIATPTFPVLAFPSKPGHLVQRGHANLPFLQVWLLVPSIMVANSALSPARSRRADSPACIPPDPANTVTDRLNLALNSSGSGFVLQLCPNARYMIQAPILFAAPNQEISTSGYPTDDSRATLVVSGPVENGQGHTTAVDGTCANCGGVILRNIQASIFVA
jgi:hypothetical protein